MNAARLAHDLTGDPDSPVLVLGNSLGTSWAMWDPQLPALAERFRVLRFNHRGHAGSAVPPGPYQLEDLGRDLLALLDDLSIGRFSFCGLSLGGMLGMWLAANSSDRVDKLALCCTAARIEPASLWHDRAAQVRAHGTASIADTVVARWFTAQFASGHPEIVAQTTALLAATPAEGYASCCEAIAAVDLRDVLPTIKVDTLVIAGAADPATPVEHAEQIAAGIPAAQLTVVPDAAHLANIEQPHIVTQLLLDHFSDGEVG